jgi:hypothetical protein
MTAAVAKKATLSLPFPEAPDASNGCQYRTSPRRAICGKLCEAGEVLCPHHLLLTRHGEAEVCTTTPRGYSA